MEDHNKGTEISTKRYRPWRLVAYEAYQSEKDAREREKKLKSHGNAMKEFKKRSKNSFSKVKNGAGFTLVETLVSIFIFSIIIAVVFSSVIMFYRNQSFTWDQTRAIEEARIGVKTMIREIREARLGDDGSYPIEMANDKEFIFYGDIDKDGATERVRYFIGGGGGGGNQAVEECVTFSSGGSCNVVFSNFFQ